MKKHLFFLILTSLFSLTLRSNALATSTVTFKGGAENFVFYSDGAKTDADLFGGLKNMAPGDSRIENITIKNTANEYDYIKIYLRAEPTTEEMTDFLSQLTLNVYNNGELISSASAQEPGALEDDILLGTFSYNDEISLSAEILVPTNLGNNYMHTEGEIKWIFTAEAYKDGKIINPDTGAMTASSLANAKTNILILGIMTTLILGAGVVLFIRQKRS